MSIIIKDNSEPLVDIRNYCPEIVIALTPARMRVEKTVYLRLGIAQMLCNAQKTLPEGMHFILGDAWRPEFVQAKIYFWFLRTFTKRYPRWPHKQIIHEIENYVAPWKGKGASGHMTGGAIDVRLVDQHGRKLRMKSSTLNYQENALSHQTKLPAYIQKNRKLLRTALESAGFSNYPKEYWHWSYGDYYWAKRNKKSIAIYAPIADVNCIYEKELCPCRSGKVYTSCHFLSARI